MEMPIAAAGDSVNTAVTTMPFWISSKVSSISKSEEMQDSSSSTVFVRIGTFPEKTVG